MIACLLIIIIVLSIVNCACFFEVNFAIIIMAIILYVTPHLSREGLSIVRPPYK